MSKFIPSAYQQAVFDFIQTEKKNLIISAVAGSGKTTTILEALNRIPSDNRIIFLAFNKAIVDELKEKIPFGVHVRTFHSLGFSTLKKFNKKIKVDANKSKILIKRVSDDEEWRHNFETFGELIEYNTRISRLVDLGRMELVRNDKDFYELTEKHGILCVSDEIEKAKMFIEMMDEDFMTVDFTDMIYRLATNLDFIIHQYDYVFVDECQDLNKAQQTILKQLVSPIGGRFIAVGDPYQSIYGFSGADYDSYDRLKNSPKTVELPLSVCYRCPKKIVKLAQKIVPHIEHCETAEEGVVNYKGTVDEVKEGDWVLCRTYRPLAKLCMSFIVQGKKATIRGIDFGKNLITLIEKTKKKNLEEVFNDLRHKYNIARKKLMNKGLMGEDLENDSVLVAMREKNSVIIILATGCKTVEQVKDKISKIFSDNVEGIVMSTIHKAKGLENDRIFIIRSDLLPLPYATKPWQMIQERNLEYVAYTRAKKELIFINDLEN